MWKCFENYSAILTFKLLSSSLSYREAEEWNNRPFILVSGDFGFSLSSAIMYSGNLGNSLNFPGPQFTKLQNKKFGLDE